MRKLFGLFLVAVAAPLLFVACQPDTPDTAKEYVLEITSDTRFSASALPFSVKQLDVRALGNNQAHSLELKSLAHENERTLGRTWVNFDLVQQGLGCVNSWGALPLEQYRIKAEPMSFRFILRPLAN